MYLVLTDDEFCMILNCIYYIVYCCIYYVCNNLVALLKPAQYVQTKKDIIIIKVRQHFKAAESKLQKKQMCSMMIQTSAHHLLINHKMFKRLECIISIPTSKLGQLSNHISDD